MFWNVSNLIIQFFFVFNLEKKAIRKKTTKNQKTRFRVISLSGWSNTRSLFAVVFLSGIDQGGIFKQKWKVVVTFTVRLSLNQATGLCILFFKLAISVSWCLSTGHSCCMKKTRGGMLLLSFTFPHKQHRATFENALNQSATCWLYVCFLWGLINMWSTFVSESECSRATSPCVSCPLC